MTKSIRVDLVPEHAILGLQKTFWALFVVFWDPSRHMVTNPQKYPKFHEIPLNLVKSSKKAGQSFKKAQTARYNRFFSLGLKLWD